MSKNDKRYLAEALVRQYPPLALALDINNCICGIFRNCIKLITYPLRQICRLSCNYCKKFANQFCTSISPKNGRYELLKPVINPVAAQGAIPYRDDTVKQYMTYYGGLILGFLLYLFVYYVLIKHHSYITIGIALILLIIYMVILENSHNVRSIIMLSLPIMFTNRGRALIYCFMISLTLIGPIQNTHMNVDVLHSSMLCCRQYSTIKVDKSIEQNVMGNVMDMENVINKIVALIKDFAESLREEFKYLIELAMTVDRYIRESIEHLKDILAVCNGNSSLIRNCLSDFDSKYKECLRKESKSGSTAFCEQIKSAQEFCQKHISQPLLCQIPRSIMKFLDETIGSRLEKLMERLEHEFYFDIDIKHNYTYKNVKSKQFKQIAREIKLDIRTKFWYLIYLNRFFNLLTLILVCYILLVASLYHMHYLTDLKYDNMYLDYWLKRLDERRKRSINDKSFADYDNDNLNAKLLFPIGKLQQQAYLEPFSLRMNHGERQKLRLSSIIWFLIFGFCLFFMIMDNSLYTLIDISSEQINKILFDEDLPLFNVQTSVIDESNMLPVTTKLNRTYLRKLRNEKLESFRQHYERNSFDKSGDFLSEKQRLTSKYRAFIGKIEQTIPDEIAILDSIKSCLPKAYKPNEEIYKNILILGIITLLIVFCETYAMRTRHCIANLYFPNQARRRAIWLYKKMLDEKVKFELEERDKKRDKIIDRRIMK